MFSNSNSGLWSLTPELQKRFEEIQAQTRMLQEQLGITPMTLDERAVAYTKRKEDERKRQEELAKLTQITGQRRPPPKWKV